MFQISNNDCLIPTSAFPEVFEKKIAEKEKQIKKLQKEFEKAKGIDKKEKAKKEVEKTEKKIKKLQKEKEKAKSAADTYALKHGVKRRTSARRRR